MAYRIEGEFDGPLLPPIPRAKAWCKTCGPTIWQREDIYLSIKEAALSHLKRNPTHIVRIEPENQQPYEWKKDVVETSGDKPPF